MPGLGLNAYKQTINTTISGRDLEASVLTKAAHLLKDCQEHWDEEDHFRRLDEALIFNQKVWTIFQDEIVRENNPLPKEVRSNILNLSLFIDKRIVEIMKKPVPDKLDMIIDINLNIAAGLRGSPA
jgi:flagellar biosynthesis activator protein FlaF